MRRMQWLWLALLGHLLAAAPCWAGPITQIVVFGDSLSDTGNLFAASGQPPSPYYNGHFSNGPIWVEQLADRLGVPQPLPFSTSPKGTDFAFGGATTGSDWDGGKVPNIIAQVNLYLNVLHNTPNSGQLFTVWGGANDVFNALAAKVPYDATKSVNNIATAITMLAQNGAKNFLVPNLPLLGHTPFGQGSAFLDGLSESFNSLLAPELHSLATSLGVNIRELDAAALLTGVQANKAKYGLTNVTGSAFDDKHYDGKGYLFWDDVHPTTVGQGIIADAAALQLPEPSSLLLALSASAGVLFWKRRQTA